MMKTLAILVMVTALLLTSSLAMASAPEYGALEPLMEIPEAPGGGPWDFPTMVDKGFWCALGPWGDPTDKSHAVFSRPGNQTLTCVGEANEAPDRAVFEEGFQCGLWFLGIWTYNSKITVTPAGKVILTCHTENPGHE
jgi:hypothetical protein